MKKEVWKIADEIYPEMLDFCKRIVKTPSISGDEGNVAEMFYHEMNRLGYDDVFIDDWGNVIGVVNGTQKDPVIMYNGHLDTVPEGNSDDWGGYDPYGAEIDISEMLNPFTDVNEKTEVIHGRGTGDLKCNLASQVYAGAILVRLKKQGYSFKGTFLLTAVVLEENGEMMGTVKLCEGILKEKGIEADAMICCEPSSMRIMLGHRGRMEIRVVIKGRSCHGSSPWLGINAVEKSAKFRPSFRKTGYSTYNVSL